MLPTLLALASLFTQRYTEYADTAFPNARIGVDAEVLSQLRTPYDFVIVGSGYAGSFLARQLANGGCNRILVLEAGGAPSFDFAIPFTRLQDVSSLEWNYMSVPQKKAAQAMRDHKVHLMVGKSLGGDAAVDSGLYVPPNLADFHRWSYTHKLKGWGYVDMKPYMFKLPEEKERRRKGLAPEPPLKEFNMSRAEILHSLRRGIAPNLMEPLQFAWLQAGKSLNYTAQDGVRQAVFHEGGFFLPRTMAHNGIKLNPAAQFLRRMEDNLHILSHTEAVRLLYDQDQRRVAGIEFRDLLNNKTYSALVNREVLLAAGPIGSPQILLQSGLGPADLLRSQRIPVVRDLPVGVRLTDRVSAHLFVKILLQSGLGPADLLRSQRIPVVRDLPVGVRLTDRVSAHLFVKILLQSGLGPADLLRSQRIPVVRDLPVGVRLTDRVSAHLFVKILLQSGLGPADLLRSQRIPVVRDLPVGVRLTDRVSAHLFVKILLQSGLGPADLLRSQRIPVVRDLPVGVRLTDRVSAHLFVKILLQSGLGPADLLRSQRIPVVRDLPVGVRLTDRVSAHLFVKIHPQFVAGLKSQLNDPRQLHAYLINGTGILANASVSGCAIVHSGILHSTPDLLIEMKPIGILGIEELMQTTNYSPEVLNQIDPTAEAFREGCLQMTVTVLRPFSVGTMWIWRKHDGSFQPRMNPSYLSDGRDTDALVKGARHIEAMLEEEYLGALGTELLYPRFPDCPPPARPATDEYWACVMKHLATTGNHLASAVPLGDVVDERLNVRGMGGVRVVDQSVFPEPASGGVSSTVLAVANRAFKFIRDDHRLQC